MVAVSDENRIPTGTMIESISKPKLPKGLAYVLKTSHLEQALEEAGIDTPVELVYWMPQETGSILEGHYWLANEHVHYARVYVRAGCVAATQRRAAAEALRRLGLPRFVEWLKAIVGLPNDSPKLHTELYFDATYKEDCLSVSTVPRYKCRK